MKIYRGVVCETNKKYTVFLTKNGEFLRGVPVHGAVDIGEETEFHLLSTGGLSRKVKKPLFYGPVAVAAMVFLFVIASLFQTGDKVMAYVQLETDTPIEFGVDENGRIVTLRALSDRMPILDEELNKWKGQSIQSVLPKAVKSLSPMQGSSDMKSIVVTTVFQADAKNETRAAVEKAVTVLKNNTEEVHVDVAESTAEERTKANKNSMTIHSYNKNKKEKNMSGKKPQDNKKPNENGKRKNEPGSQNKGPGKSQQKPNNPNDNRGKKKDENKPQRGEEKSNPSSKNNKDKQKEEKKNDNGKGKNPNSQGNQKDKQGKNNNQKQNDKGNDKKSNNGNNGKQNNKDRNKQGDDE